MDRLIQKDLKYIWHPYVQMKDCEEHPPILIKKARGVKLYDRRGKFYYDTISSWWCNVHGHNHPRIKKAIKKQLDSLEHTLFAGFTHKPAIFLAEKLVAITPGNLTRVFFSDNGSTSVEVALKMSFQYWQQVGRPRKGKFVCLDNAYHGDTLGAVSVGGVKQFRGLFRPLLFPVYQIPSPYCYRCPMKKSREDCRLECLQPLERMLREKSSEIAAIILEPLLQAAGGMIVYPPQYLADVARLARKFSVHLILDEVATGFGRTGKMFASDHVLIQPDFMCLSKGITSGYLPLGVTLTTEEIYRAFYADYDQNKTFFHGHTFTANPLACAAARASLDLFRRESTFERARELIPVFQAGLEEMRALPHVGDVRHIGMVGGLELVKDKKTRKPFSPAVRVGYRIYLEGLGKNLLLRPLDNVIYLFLPLSTTRTELTDILERTHDVIAGYGFPA